MVRLTVEGQERVYQENTLLRQVAEEFQHQHPFPIVLALVNGKLQELTKPVKEGTVVEFLTAQSESGMKTYWRSVVLLFLKSFYEIVGQEKIEKVSMNFALGEALFVEACGDFALTEELLGQVKAKMKAYVNLDLPITKRSINTDEAIELFHSNRMYDKEKLFQFRRVSRVNLYGLEGFEDYYYGYMVPSTSYLSQFDLRLYHHGLLLMMPGKADPDHVAVVGDMEKLYQVMQDSEEWGRKLRVADVGSLNEMISKSKMNELILIQEAIMEKRMGDIAEMIASQPNKKLVMIAGPSSSGKTTFSYRLSIQLQAKGLIPHPIAVDNYFVNRVDTPRDEKGEYNFEILECIDIEQFNRDMTDLLAGKKVELPVYNFIKGEREYCGDYLQLGPNDILVIEGIHCLNERLSYSLPKENKFKIYISALTQLNIDEHNRIPTTDGRLLRRIVRDARTRGSSAQNTIKMWPSVRRGEEENIFPYQEEADVMFNSALVYELAVLKQYAEPLLFGIPRDSAEFLEARRLLKFLDYFLGVSSEDIPRNSILREFIGGSCFKKV